MGQCLQFTNEFGSASGHSQFTKQLERTGVCNQARMNQKATFESPKKTIASKMHFGGRLLALDKR